MKSPKQSTSKSPSPDYSGPTNASDCCPPDFAPLEDIDTCHIASDYWLDKGDDQKAAMCRYLAKRFRPEPTGGRGCGRTQWQIEQAFCEILMGKRVEFVVGSSLHIKIAMARFDRQELEAMFEASHRRDSQSKRVYSNAAILHVTSIHQPATRPYRYNATTF